MSSYNPASSQIPPPPAGFRGGNRNSQHLVGGKTDNFAYTPGANLKAARRGYQSGQEGMSFRNQATVRPQFGQTANAMQAGQAPTAGQASGNTLRATAGGQIRPVNSPNGLGYQNMPGGPVRQHTTPGGMAGEEALASNLSYTPLAPPPPPVVSPTGGTGIKGVGPLTGQARTDEIDNQARITAEQHRVATEQRARDDAAAAERAKVAAAQAAAAAANAAAQNGGGTVSTGTFGGAQPGVGTVAANTPAPSPFQNKQQADDAWDRNNMGARTMRNPAGGLMRTPKYAEFLRKHGFA